MERKSRFPQSSAKGAGDSKKNQDVNSKLFPKTSHRREPSVTNAFPKYEQSRKPNAQKGKDLDKRPKPKGQYHGGPKEDSKVVEQGSAELGSVMVQGSKKRNLNHLLNFHYAPRDVQGGSGMWGQARTTTYNRNSNRWLPPVQRHKYNKEQFLQANCQFVVTANGKYTAYLTNPDILVDWNLIEQIRVHSSESLSCPICLCPPVASKMTRCGHVYCWPCILHYLSLSDKSWRKCPICYESIHKSDLKSVVEFPQHALNLGDKVTLRLMRREKGSSLATFVEEIDSPAPTTFFSVSAHTSRPVYSKLLLANRNDVMDIIECERVQLNLELMEDPHSPENCFIEQALDELLAREKQLFQTVEPVEAGSMEKAEVVPIEEISTVENAEQCEPDAGASRCESNCSVGLPSRDDVHSSADELTTKMTNAPSDQQTSNTPTDRQTSDASTDQQMPNAASKFFYFYQAEDGQHVYLHAMNVKMLELQYGSLEHCPRVITGKLLEKEGGSFTEELRRRLRYLCHLPLTCQFEVAEIELKPPIISKEVLDHFNDQLETRRKRRQRRERDERKREKKITEEENRRMGRYPTPKVHIESRRHFPQWQPEQQCAGVNISSPTESTAASIASSPSTSTLEEIAPAQDESSVCSSSPGDQGPSFAEMLRNNGTRPGGSNAWPNVDGSYSTQTRPLARPNDRKPRDNDADDEEQLSAPSYSQSFGDALAQALEQSELLDTSGSKEVNVGGGGKKKKKRGKPTVLFATSMARSP